MQHLACIMDGNRRWAKSRGKDFRYGYEEGGAKAIDRVSDFCIEHGIKYLSLYAFSIENFRRPRLEREFLFAAMVRHCKQALQGCLKRGIRVRFIGDTALFPSAVRSACKRLEEQTKHLSRLNLNFLFCYGARQEIVSVVKILMEKYKSGAFKESELSEKVFSQYLWTAGIPEPDVILRTSGVKRLSNFLLYQAAYSEFYFLDCEWPDVSEDHLRGVLDYFAACKRSFGV